MGLLNDFKDKTTSFGLKKYLNSNYGQYGEVRDISIDTSLKTIFLDALLNGEKETFTLKLINYNITERAGESYIRFKDVETSREWINLVIRNLVPQSIKDNGIKIPKEYESLIKSFL